MAMVPAEVWETRQRMPGLIPTARVWLMMKLRGKDTPQEDAIVERRLQVTQMALDVARQLRLNDTTVNTEVIQQVAFLLHVDLNLANRNLAKLIGSEHGF